MPFTNPHPLYSVWQGMLGRCRNPNVKQFADYGGRGIAVCERWKSFANFLEDMGPRPRGTSLDRIDNDKDYGPENCRWATRREQQLNRRVTVFVTVEGVRYRAIDLAEINGIKTDTVVRRANQGLSYAEVITGEKRRDLTGLALGVAARKAKAAQRVRVWTYKG